MAAMANVDTNTPIIEDGSCLQQENSSLRQTIAHLTEQLQAADRDKSNIVTGLQKQLQMVKEEKSAIEAQL